MGKKVTGSQSWRFFENFPNLVDFRTVNPRFCSKNCPSIQKSLYFPKICVWLYSFSFESYDIVFGMPNLHKICNTEKFFDFRFFDFLSYFFMIFVKTWWKCYQFACFCLFFRDFGQFWTKSWKKTRQKSKNRKSKNFSMLQILWRLCTPNLMW